MELEEYIKDGFGDLLRDYIRLEEYVAKKQEEWLLAEFQSGLSSMQRQQFRVFLDVSTVRSRMPLSRYIFTVLLRGLFCATGWYQNRRKDGAAMVSLLAGLFF